MLDEIWIIIMMKWLFKWIGIGLLVIVLVGGIFVVYEWYVDKFFYFNNLFNWEMVKVVFDSFEILIFFGFLELMGIKGYNVEFDDVS